MLSEWIIINDSVCCNLLGVFGPAHEVFGKLCPSTTWAMLTLRTYNLASVDVLVHWLRDVLLHQIWWENDFLNVDLLSSELIQMLTEVFHYALVCILCIIHYSLDPVKVTKRSEGTLWSSTITSTSTVSRLNATWRTLRSCEASKEWVATVLTLPVASCAAVWNRKLSLWFILTTALLRSIKVHVTILSYYWGLLVWFPQERVYHGRG